MKEQGCQKARERLILSYLYLIPITRRRVAKGTREALWDEIEGEGRLALVKAVDKYVPDRGVLFLTFALQWVRGAMCEYLRRDDWVPRTIRQRIRAGEEVTLIEVISLEEAISDPADRDQLTLADKLADPFADTEGEVTISLARAVAGRLVDALPLRQRKIMRRRYWDEWPLHAIGAQIGISASRVEQIHSETLGQLRHWLVPWESVDAGR